MEFPPPPPGPRFHEHSIVRSEKSMQDLLTYHYHLLTVFSQIAASCATLAFLLAIFVSLGQLFAVRQAKLSYHGWTTNLGWYLG